MNEINKNKELIFIIIIPVFTTATAAEAKTLNETDDRHSQEETHQPTELSYELDTVLREVVDALVLERSHIELENNCVGGSSLDGLAGSCHLGLQCLLLDVCVRSEGRVH